LAPRKPECPQGLCWRRGRRQSKNTNK
jgi:hypothetical protein